MDRSQIKKIIEEKGNIMVLFEPLNYDANKIPQENLIEIIRKASVRLRGWDFPHIPQTDKEDTKKPYSIGNGIEFYTYCDKFVELFRLYQSGQFIGLFSMYEDTIGEAYGNKIDSGKYLDFVTTVYRATEIVLFIKNLIEDTDISGGKLTLEINNTKDRELEVIFSQNILPLHAGYICRIEKVVVSVEFDREDILLNNLEIARKLIKGIFLQFNWTNYSDQTIKTHQDNLLNRRM